MAYWQVRDGFNSNDVDNIDKIQVDDLLFLVREGIFVAYTRCVTKLSNGIKFNEWEEFPLDTSLLISSLERGNYNQKIALIKNSNKVTKLLSMINSFEIYKLQRLKITNFRLIEQLEIYFNEDINVIIANNGAGKTTILDAVAIGLGVMVNQFHDSLPFKEQDLRINAQNKIENFMRISLKSTSNLVWDISKNKSKISTKMKSLIPPKYGNKEIIAFSDRIIDSQYEEKDFVMPLVIYYKTNRAIFDAPMRKRNFKKEFSRFDALDGVLKRDANFHRLFQWFDVMENQERKERDEKWDKSYRLGVLEEVRKAIEGMLPDFKNPHIETNPLRFMIDKVEDGKITSLNIEQLSDGYRTVLAMVMDISARMSQANPHIGNNSKAIILIDELDLHLHPKWQQTILSDLRETFPNAQFIVTTHSPHIISSIEKEKLFKLENRKIQYQYQSTYGKPIDELLLSSFALESLRYPKVKEKIIFLEKFIYSDKYTQKDFYLYLEALEKEIGKDDIAILKLKLEKLKRDKNAKD